MSLIHCINEEKFILIKLVKMKQKLLNQEGVSCLASTKTFYKIGGLVN